ncbi:MAG: hypothetical protein JWQ29_3232, partial [Phenylobacterium sp.]|nr:hypothetical protein [Phenylobacterium sp.]
MPQVNLSALSGPDLRRLLDATRGRGDAALSYQILQEMADRRERPGRRGPFMTRQPAESRVIAMDLGDPMAREEEDDLPPMPHWRPPSSEASAAAPPEPGPAQRRPRRRKAQAVPVEAAAEVPVEPVAPAEAEPAPHPPQELRPLSLRDADRETPPDAAAGPPDWDLRFQPP